MGMRCSVGAPCHVCATYPRHNYPLRMGYGSAKYVHVLPMYLLWKRHVNAMGALWVYVMGTPWVCHGYVPCVTCTGSPRLCCGCAMDMLRMRFRCGLDAHRPFACIGREISIVGRQWARWGSAVGLP